MKNTLRENMIRRLARMAKSGCGSPGPMVAKKGVVAAKDGDEVDVKVKKAAEDTSEATKLKHIPTAPGSGRTRPYV